MLLNDNTLNVLSFGAMSEGAAQWCRDSEERRASGTSLHELVLN